MIIGVGPGIKPRPRGLWHRLQSVMGTRRTQTVVCATQAPTPLYCSSMTPELFREIIVTYQRHGWELRRALLKPTTRSDLGEQAAGLFDETKLIDSEIDALWFARPSHAGREAWELRLVAEQPFALFEAFEADETEAEREEARVEMENRMREFAAKSG